MIQSTAPQEVELIQDQQARLANQKAEQEKAEKAEMIQPLTVEQLNSLYHNRRLEANVDFIKKFVEVLFQQYFYYCKLSSTSQNMQGKQPKPLENHKKKTF